jgi:hypothetical protein
MLRSQVPDDGPPTPRAQTYIDSGEWDSGVLLQLTCDVAQFCGLRRSDCSSRSHLISMWKLFRPGWRIPGGSHKGAGFFRGPSLPSADAGGPVTATITQNLRSKVDPFALSGGQWKFVLDEWIIWRATSSSRDDAAFSFETETEDDTQDPLDSTEPQAPVPSLSSVEAAYAAASGGIPEVKKESQAKVEAPDISKGVKAGVGSLVSSVPQLPASMSPPNRASGPASNPPPDPTPIPHATVPVPAAVPSPIPPTPPAPIPMPSQESKDIEKLKTQVEQLNILLRGFGKPSTDQVSRIEELEHDANMKALAGDLDWTDRVLALEQENQSLQADIGRLALTVHDPSGELSIIHEQLNILKAASKVGRGVDRHGVSFGHPSEIGPVLRSVGGSVTIFHDAVSLLHSIGATPASHRSTLSTMKAQRDVKITTDLEAWVITSFRTNLPAILYGGSASVETVDEYVSLLSKLKSYGAWHSDDGVSGVSQRMLRGSIAIQARVSFLASQLTTDPGILRLSNGLLIDMDNFIQRLVGFIDATYIEYKVLSYMGEDQLWELLVSFIEQVFEDLRAAQCMTQDASEGDSSLLLWGIMKAQHDFRKPPP